MKVLTPQTVEKMSDTNLKEEQNARVNGTCQRKGKKAPTPFKRPFVPRNPSGFVSKGETICLGKLLSLCHTCTCTHTSLLQFCHSSSIKSAILIRVICPLYIYSLFYMTLLLLIHSFCGDFLRYFSLCILQLFMKTVSTQHIPSLSLKQI